MVNCIRITIGNEIFDIKGEFNLNSPISDIIKNVLESNDIDADTKSRVSEAIKKQAGRLKENKSSFVNIRDYNNDFVGNASALTVYRLLGRNNFLQDSMVKRLLQVNRKFDIYPDKYNYFVYRSSGQSNSVQGLRIIANKSTTIFLDTNSPTLLQDFIKANVFLFANAAIDGYEPAVYGAVSATANKIINTFSEQGGDNKPNCLIVNDVNFKNDFNTDMPVVTKNIIPVEDVSEKTVQLISRVTTDKVDFVVVKSGEKYSYIPLGKQENVDDSEFFNALELYAQRKIDTNNITPISTNQDISVISASIDQDNIYVDPSQNSDFSNFIQSDDAQKYKELILLSFQQQGFLYQLFKEEITNMQLQIQTALLNQIKKLEDLDEKTKQKLDKTDFLFNIKKSDKVDTKITDEQEFLLDEISEEQAESTVQVKIPLDAENESVLTNFYQLGQLLKEFLSVKTNGKFIDEKYQSEERLTTRQVYQKLLDTRLKLEGKSNTVKPELLYGYDILNRIPESLLPIIFNDDNIELFSVILEDNYSGVQFKGSIEGIVSQLITQLLEPQQESQQVDETIKINISTGSNYFDKNIKCKLSDSYADFNTNASNTLSINIVSDQNKKTYARGTTLQINVRDDKDKIAEVIKRSTKSNIKLSQIDEAMLSAIKDAIIKANQGQDKRIKKIYILDSEFDDKSKMKNAIDLFMQTNVQVVVVSTDKGIQRYLNDQNISLDRSSIFYDKGNMSTVSSSTVQQIQSGSVTGLIVQANYNDKENKTGKKAISPSAEQRLKRQPTGSVFKIKTYIDSDESIECLVKGTIQGVQLYTNKMYPSSFRKKIDIGSIYTKDNETFVVIDIDEDNITVRNPATGAIVNIDDSFTLSTDDQYHLFEKDTENGRIQCLYVKSNSQQMCVIDLSNDSSSIYYNLESDRAKELARVIYQQTTQRLSEITGWSQDNIRKLNINTIQIMQISPVDSQLQQSRAEIKDPTQIYYKYLQNDQLTKIGKTQNNLPFYINDQGVIEINQSAKVVTGLDLLPVIISKIIHEGQIQDIIQYVTTQINNMSSEFGDMMQKEGNQEAQVTSFIINCARVAFENNQEERFTNNETMVEILNKIRGIDLNEEIYSVIMAQEKTNATTIQLLNLSIDQLLNNCNSKLLSSNSDILSYDNSKPINDNEINLKCE